MSDEVPGTVVMAQLGEIKDALVRLDTKFDEKFGDHATRIARLEVQGEHQQRQIHDLQQQLREATTSRRWTVTTVVAVFGVLVAIGSLLTAIILGG